MTNSPKSKINSLKTMNNSKLSTKKNLPSKHPWGTSKKTSIKSKKNSRKTRAVKPKSRRSSTISKDKRTQLYRNRSNSKMKSPNSKKQSKRKSTWSSNRKGKNKLLKPKSPKRNMNFQSWSTTTLPKLTTRRHWTTRTLSWTKKLNKPKSNLTLLSLKLEGFKSKSISAGIS